MNSIRFVFLLTWIQLLFTDCGISASGKHYQPGGGPKSHADTSPPTIPGSPSLASATTSSLQLSWQTSTDNVGVVTYLVDVSTSSGFTSFVSGWNAASVGNVTSVLISNLSSGTTYYSRVRAEDAAGNISGYSTVVSLATLSSGSGTQPLGCATPINIGSGVQYFVSPSGSDTAGNGSNASPWQTLQYGFSHLNAGDTLNAMAGTYNTGIVCGYDNSTLYGSKNGVAGNPITVRADPAALPGSVIVTGINPASADAFDFGYSQSCSYIQLIGFTIKDPNGVICREAIRTYGPGNVIANNKIIGVGCSGGGMGIFTAYDKGGLIQGNEVSGTLGSNNYGHPIYLSYQSQNTVVQYNYLHDNGNSFHVNSQDYSTTYPPSTNILINGNTIVNSNDASVDFDGVQNSKIVNNLIYGYSRSGVLIYWVGGGGPSTGNIIVNNTIVSTSADNDSAIRFINGSINTTILNNALYDWIQGIGPHTYSYTSDSLKGLVSDYNIEDPSALYRNEDSGYSYLSLSGWQAALHLDLNTRTATQAQVFLNPGMNDYHLSATSLAIDGGTSIDAPNIDISCNPRPVGAGFDMGAYEKQ